MIEIKFEPVGLDKALKSLDPKHVTQAAYRAINDAARASRTEASRRIREKFNLPASRVNQEVKTIKLAKRSDLSATIQAQGRPIGLTNFGARWVRNAASGSRTTTKTKSTFSKRKSKNTGVNVRILKGKTTRLPSAFIGRGARGKVKGAGSLHVFQRVDKGKGSYLINKSVITLPSMMKQPDVMKNLIKKAETTLERRFWHHLERLMK